jgi:hypothetical protein
MNMVNLEGKKVMVQPSQAESTKRKVVVIGEERQPRMIKVKSLKDGQWKKNERKSHNSAQIHFRHPHGKVQERQGRCHEAQKSDHPISQTGPSGFPRLGQYLCSRQYVHQVIQDTIAAKFKRLGSSSKGVSYGALLPVWATNAGTMGASTDDVSALSTLGRVVRALDSTAQALLPGMVRISGRFWSWGYHAGDGRDESVGQQQDRRSQGQEN